MQIITGIEQGSPEWLDLRLGLITCSEISTIRANGVGAQSYINGLAYELINHEPAEVFQGNEWTKRGQQLESKARQRYEEKTGYTVSMVSFVKNKGFGYSPDGLIIPDKIPVGGIEIKVKTPKTQIAILRSGEIPKEHIDQLIGGICCAELQWMDFVSYCPNLPLFVKRVYANDVRDKIENIEALVKLYNEQTQAIKDKILEMY